MIIIDLSLVTYAMAYYTKPLTETTLKSAVLRKIGTLRTKLAPRFGRETILACDGNSPYWRHDIYPLYKMGKWRSKNREERQQASLILKQMIPEFSAYLPMKTICLPKIEADDVMAAIVKHYPGPHVICTRDSDVIQLENENVFRCNPLDSTVYPSSPEPFRALCEKVLRGDTTDCIPNIRSAGSPGIRQKPMYTQVINEMIDTIVANGFDALPVEYHENIKRNRNLIDHTLIPQWVEESIINAVDTVSVPDSKGVHKYLVTRRLVDVLPDLRELL